MAHVTLKQNYKHLSDRLNLFPQGAPPTDLFFRILQVLFTEREAELVARLPVRPFSVASAARNQMHCQFFWNPRSPRSFLAFCPAPVLPTPVRGEPRARPAWHGTVAADRPPFAQG